MTWGYKILGGHSMGLSGIFGRPMSGRTLYAATRHILKFQFLKKFWHFWVFFSNFFLNVPHGCISCYGRKKCFFSVSWVPKDNSRDFWSDFCQFKVYNFFNFFHWNCTYNHDVSWAGKHNRFAWKNVEILLGIWITFLLLNVIKWYLGWKKTHRRTFQKWVRNFCRTPKNPPYGQKFLPQRV